MELNTKLQAAFRRYNPAIPFYLRERPHFIIKHCLDRLALAEAIPNSHVHVIDITNGVFKVRSQTSLEEKTSYDVLFGMNQPSCTCYDWERQRLPCKHFFAVFRHVPSWSLDNLPSAYKDSPFFTLDGDLFVPDNIETTDSIDKENVVEPLSQREEHASVVVNEAESVQFQYIPRTTPRARNSSAKCRELLGQIKNITYIVEGWQNGEILDELRNKLEECHNLLLKAAPKENGVILEAPLQKSSHSAGRKMKRGKKEKKVDFKRLPVAPKRNRFSGRAGEKANQMKRHYNVSLRDMECKPAKLPKLNKDENDKIGDSQQHSSKILFTGGKLEDANETKEQRNNTAAQIEQPVKPGSVPCHPASSYEEVGLPTDRKMPEDATCKIQEKSTASENEQPVKPESTTCTPPAVLSQHGNRDADTEKSSIDCETSNAASESEVEFVRSTKGVAPKNGSFLLSETDIKEITTGERLTDHVIGSAHSILRKQFPYIGSEEWKTPHWGQLSTSQFKRVNLHKSSTQEVITGFWFLTLDV